METTLGTVLGALQTGLPVLLLQFATALALLALGVTCYVAITPFHEWRLVREGNVAAGVVLAGTVVALAIPLAATLAASLVTLDIALWGLVALVLQLLAFAAVALLAKRAPGHDRGRQRRRGVRPGRRPDRGRADQRRRDGRLVAPLHHQPERLAMIVPFIRNLAGVKADQAAQGALEALVRWDPKAATEAELRTMEQHLDDLGIQVAQARAAYDRERREADAIQQLSQQRMAAAEQLERQMAGRGRPGAQGGAREEPGDAGRHARADGARGRPRAAGRGGRAGVPGDARADLRRGGAEAEGGAGRAGAGAARHGPGGAAARDGAAPGRGARARRPG